LIPPGAIAVAMNGQDMTSQPDRQWRDQIGRTEAHSVEKVIRNDRMHEVGRAVPVIGGSCRCAIAPISRFEIANPRFFASIHEPDPIGMAGD
jgi:hypothetical protein